MYDFIKAVIPPRYKRQLLENPLLDFEGRHSEKTGAVTSPRKVAEYKGLKFIAFDSGLHLSELKRKYNEEQLFHVGLKHVTTTKKAFCEALKIPVEAGCRYKRTLEKEGLLVQSVDEVICPGLYPFGKLLF